MLKAEVLEVDESLNRQEGRYFNSLRLGELKGRLVNAPGSVIAEGICLLQVLGAVAAPYDELVVTGDPEGRIAELLARQQEFDRAAGFQVSEELPAGWRKSFATMRSIGRKIVRPWNTGRHFSRLMAAPTV